MSRHAVIVPGSATLAKYTMSFDGSDTNSVLSGKAEDSLSVVSKRESYKQSPFSTRSSLSTWAAKKLVTNQQSVMDNLDEEEDDDGSQTLKRKRADLLRILGNIQTSKQFSTFLATRHAEENLAFLMHLASMTPTNFHFIFEIFITENAPMEINITADCRSKLIEHYKALEGKEVDNSVFKIFDDAQEEIWTLLQNILPEFGFWSKSYYNIYPKVKDRRVKVLVVGAGPCGMVAATMLNSMEVFDVVVVNRTEYSEFKPALKYVTAPQKFNEYHIDLNTLKNVRVIVGDVNRINIGFVTIGEHVIPYDYIIIATGTINEVSTVSQNFISLDCRNKASGILSRDLDKYKTIIVYGNDQYAVTTAADIMYNFPDKKVVLLTGTESILEQCSSDERNLARDELKNLNVEIITHLKILKLHTKISGSDQTKVVLSNGDSMVADYIIYTKSYTDNKKVIELENVLSESQKLVVDSSLAVVGNFGKAKVYAGGDCAEVNDPKMRYDYTYNNAMICGCIIARNICRDYKGKPTSHAGAKGMPKFIPSNADMMNSLSVGSNIIYSPLIMAALAKKNKTKVVPSGSSTYSIDSIQNVNFMEGFENWSNALTNKERKDQLVPPKKVSFDDRETFKITANSRSMVRH